MKTTSLLLGTGVSFSKEPRVARDVLSSALKCGITRFDTAPSYKSEGILGNILAEKCAEYDLKREELYIQTKIDAWQMQDGSIDKFVMDALNKLKTDYIDALLIHWPIPEYMEATWRKMDELKCSGVIRKTGICNVRLRQWNPDIIQLERSPLNTFDDEVAFCHKHNIEIQAYSPLCKMDLRIKDSHVVKKIASKHGKDQGQTVLRWHLDTGVNPIFTTTKVSRIQSYSNLFDFNLSSEEIDEISGLNENYKMYLESVSCPGF